MSQGIYPSSLSEAIIGMPVHVVHACFPYFTARDPGAANHTLLGPRCHLDDHELVARKSVCFQESRFVESRDLHLLQLAPTMCLGHVPCLCGWYKRNCSGLNLEEEAETWKARKAAANTCARRTLQAEAAGELRVGGERGGQFRTQVAVEEMMDQMLPSAQ